ncbi:unnamed protein product [Mytilus coruscus]|uniref:Integrase zinc-binding domain-containing protein n=1 Tax=Mytilus coruscus TaxID=42192 RepID=A0A6J8DYG2_MYTCO|nr:unnamed protein product [Mytilus coruscus]
MDNQDASMSAQKVEIAFNGVANELDGLREVVNLQGDVATELKGGRVCSNLLNLANEAYSDLDGHNEATERELVGIFIDGLAHSYLKMKLMRENPATFALAVKSAMTEQNLRKRFTLRTERVDEPRFVPSFSKIAEPIVALTRKNKVFDWTNTCQVALEKLRGELVKVPLLAYPDLNKPYVLYTDASDNCVGACLTQVQESPVKGENEVERPIHFLSHKLSDTQTLEDIPEKENFQFEEFDMSIEQVKDKTLRELKEQLVSDKVSEAVQNKYIIIDDVLYYISNVDNDPIIRLYIPSHIKQAVVEQYHDKNGHMGIDKTFDSIRQKYFWLNMFKELYNYVTTCVPC